MILPFIVLLLSIAFMPFIHLHWWEKNYPKVAVALGAVAIIYYIGFLGQPGRVAEVAHEYISFIALIGSLFVVAGGIHISVRGEATPLRNTVFLAIGAVAANFIGTTGASMLMIRPWIRMNKYRITAFHVVFFIFIVSNVGGALTPIGDPPLFLGYLKGVPFFWTAEHLWMPWLVVVAALLAVFYVADSINFRRAPEAVRELETAHEEFRIDGKRNFFFIVLIIAGVFLPVPWREIAMVAAALGSWYATPRRIHEMNHFNLHPIKEVAWLFFGIFGTMIPALDYLQLHSDALGVETPLQFYAFTGVLSAVLDNAPTYLTFLAAALGQKGLSLGNPADVVTFAGAHTAILVAISLGAVFFGAATYIGNGPNFMVKAIAQHAKVETPSFFGFILRFSLPVLLPVFILVGWLFFL
ncbi:MAG: sodium:proton antiporter [Chthoniobacterales bacterium]|nr:sodium:proton antiporter [Chthoniobacterales bacterium]